MKNQVLRFKQITAVVFLALLFTSCDGVGEFGDVNTDPTQANTLEPGMQFTTIQLGAAGSRFEMWRANLIYGEAIVQHLAQTWWAGDKYTFSEDWNTAFWRVAYSGAGVSWRAQIKNVQDLIANLQERKENGESVDNLLAASRVMRVFIFHRVTDLYGDTPYFEAGKGFLEQNPAPAYDSQEEIYNDMFTELDEAVNQFTAGQPTFGSADLLYGGDVAKWQKFANSLRLRLALRLIKVAPDKAQQEALAAIDAPGGVMTSNDDIAFVSHQTGPSTGPAGINTNGNSEVFAVDNPKLAKTFVDWMQSRNDPRLSVYGAILEGGQVITDPSLQKGLPNGYDTGSNPISDHPSWAVRCRDNETGEVTADMEQCSFSDYTQVNPMLTDLDDPMFFQTYAEVEFMLAEVAARGWTSDSPEQHYNAGVRAAMTYLSLYDPDGGADISDAAIDAYLAANPFQAAASMEEQLEQINTQYWGAIFLNGIEAWSNFRRSDYPDLEPSPVDFEGPYPGGTATEGQIPRRLQYPGNEGVINRENYNAAIDNQGPDEMTTSVWWDVE